MTQQAQLVLDAKAFLGEGTLWDAEQQALYWIDIVGKTLHRYTPANAVNHTWQLQQMIGCVALRQSGGLMLGLQQGFAAFDIATETVTMLHDPEPDKPHNRFNDGAVDPAGNFWAGTMPKTADAFTGALYRMDADLTVHKMLEPVGISNGLAWTSDHTTMYYIDTLLNNVRAYDYDIATGNIHNERVVIQVNHERYGHPDGMTIDTDGMLWIAHYGGSAVHRWNPHTGDILHTIELPCTNVTCCEFGGMNLDTLYITTARENLTDGQIAQQPLAGGVFKAKVNAKGVLPYRFAG